MEEIKNAHIVFHAIDRIVQNWTVGHAKSVLLGSRYLAGESIAENAENKYPVVLRQRAFAPRRLLQGIYFT